MVFVFFEIFLSFLFFFAEAYDLIGVVDLMDGWID